MAKNSKTIKTNGNITSFGGWETDKQKLLENLKWTPEQILNWLEDANIFAREIKEKKYVLRKYY